MTDNKIQEICNSLKKYDISNAEIKISGKIYNYTDLYNDYFKFGIKKAVGVIYKREKKIMASELENRITIFDHANSSVVTLKLPKYNLKSELELYAWLLEYHGYDLHEISYLINFY
jgi:Lhr-like helicase